MRILPVAVCLVFTIALLSCSEPDQPAPPSTTGGAGAVVTISEGSFVDKGGQHTSGSYRIERAGEDLRLILSDDFRTDEGPDLHIVLSPTGVAEAENENAMAEGALVVSALRSLAGGQVYDLRDDLELEVFRSVLIHCIEFTHLYGAAELRGGRTITR